MTRPPFPSVLDSSILASFRSCPRKFELEYLHHYKPLDQSVHLVAGGAYAKGLEVARTEYFVNGLPEGEAEAEGLRACLLTYGDFECPADSAKSLERTCGALEFYFSRYPMSQDRAVPITLPGGKRGIELSFAEPLEVNNPETGDPIIYCGRLDQAVDFDGLALGEDDKTTSQLGASWQKQWDLRSQFTGYCLVPGTEVLTPRGWQTIETLQPGQEIAQWEKDGSLTWVVPTELHSPFYEGALLACDGKVSFVATPDHRQVVWDTYSKSFKDYTSATLPKRSGALRFISAGHLQGGEILPEAFVRFLVAVQADGSWKDGAVRFHFSKERKAFRLQEIAETLELPVSWHNTNDYSIQFPADAYYVRLAKKYLGNEKLFGAWLLDWSQESLSVFIEEVAYWDGTTRDTRGWMYFSRQENNADWVRTVAAVTGHYSSLGMQDGMFRVNITETCQHSPHLHSWREVPYVGNVYCVTVPSSYFMIRHAGKPMITGNCWGMAAIGVKLDGFLVRGVSILKSKYDTLEAITYRPEWQIARWYKQLHRDVARMIAMWEEGYFDYNLDHACTEFGGCVFRQACLMSDPQPLFDSRFQKRKWDPLVRSETVLEGPRAGEDLRATPSLPGTDLLDQAF